MLRTCQAVFQLCAGLRADALVELGRRHGLRQLRNKVDLEQGPGHEARGTGERRARRAPMAVENGQGRGCHAKCGRAAAPWAGQGARCQRGAYPVLLLKVLQPSVGFFTGVIVCAEAAAAATKGRAERVSMRHA